VPPALEHAQKTVQSQDDLDNSQADLPTTWAHAFLPENNPARRDQSLKHRHRTMAMGLPLSNLGKRPLVDHPA
jgi:hypothetical protein